MQSGFNNMVSNQGHKNVMWSIWPLPGFHGIHVFMSFKDVSNECQSINGVFNKGVPTSSFLA
jgi:hypothetical protein